MAHTASPTRRVAGLLVGFLLVCGAAPAAHAQRPVVVKPSAPGSVRPLGDPPPFDGNAVILVGNTDGSDGAAANTADEAESDFSNYNVVRKNHATKDDAVRLISDPKTRVVVIFGHGDGDTKKSSFHEGIEMADDGNAASDDFMSSEDFAGKTFPDVDTVILHSCGQLNQESWHTLFPNATIYGWAGPTRGWQIYWWQWFFAPLYTSAPTPDTDVGLAALHNPFVGTHQQATIGSPLDPPFAMNASLSAAFGAQTVNVYGTDDAGDNAVLLTGLRIQDGHVVDFDDEGYVSPTFTVRLGYTDLFNAWERPGSIVDAFAAGRIGVAGGASGVSTQTLFDGFAAVNFGVGATLAPEPSALSLVASGLLVGCVVARRRAPYRSRPYDSASLRARPR